MVNPSKTKNPMPSLKEGGCFGCKADKGAVRATAGSALSELAI